MKPDFDLALRYRVGVTPSTIITDSNGNVVQQKVGGVGKADFLEMLLSSSGMRLNPKEQ